MVVMYKRYSDFDDWARQNYTQQDIKSIKAKLDAITEAFFGEHHEVRGKGEHDCDEIGLIEDYSRAVSAGVPMAREAVVTLLIDDCRGKSLELQIADSLNGDKDYSLLLEEILRLNMPNEMPKTPVILKLVGRYSGRGKLLESEDDVNKYNLLLQHEQNFCEHVLPTLFSSQEEPWRHCLTSALNMAHGPVQDLRKARQILDAIFA